MSSVNFNLFFNRSQHPRCSPAARHDSTGVDDGLQLHVLRGEILLGGLRLLSLRLDAVQLRTRLADDIRHNAPQKLQHRGVAVTEKA